MKRTGLPIPNVSRRVQLVLAAAVLLLISFASGAAVERNFPGALPLPALGGQGDGFDQTKVLQASSIIGANYYDSGVTGRQLSQGSVEGMVASLDDPFSQYLTAEQVRSRQDAFAGRRDGVIGVNIVFQNGYPVVSGVLPNSPALSAGLRSGDVLVRFGGMDAQGLAPEEVASLLRGPDGSRLDLVVSRDGAQLDLTVARRPFQSPTVVATRLPGDVLYLRVYQFGTATANEFDGALASGIAGARGAVLDLRGNGGGLVSAAVAMVSRFVSSGTVFQERGRDGQTSVVSVNGPHPAATVPLVVLVDGGSASSSEIVAGALQTHARAKLVGAQTFGKGSIQVLYALRDGSAINLTVQRWYLPDGRSINGVGLTPDEAVGLADPTKMFDVVNPSQGYAGDTQLTKALAMLQS